MAPSEFTNRQAMEPIAKTFSPSKSNSKSKSTSKPKSKSPPKPEDAVVDADAIERWLTSPPKAKATKASNDAISYALKQSKMSVADISMRRRSQQMLQEQQQQKQQQQQRTKSTSPQKEEHRDTTTKTTAVPSPQSSDRRSRLLKKQRQQLKQKLEQQKQSLIDNHPADTDAPVRKDVAASDKGISHKSPSKASRVCSHDQDLTDISITTANATAESKNRTFVETHEGNEQRKDNSDESALGSATPGRLDAKLSRSVGTASPGIEAIRRRRQSRFQQRELEKELQQLEVEEQEQLASTMRNMMRMTTSPHDPGDSKHDESVVVSPRSSRLSLEVNSQSSISSSTTNQISPPGKHRPSRSFKFDKNEVRNYRGDDKHIFAVSPNTNIHLLKRHDACDGSTPVSSKPRPFPRKDGVIVDDSSTEHDQPRSPFITANKSYSSSPPIRTSHHSSVHPLENSDDQLSSQNVQRQQQEKQQCSQHGNSQANDDRLNKVHCNRQNQPPQEDDQKQYIVDINGSVANKKNTQRIKEALSRARSNRRGIDPEDDEISFLLGLSESVSNENFQTENTSRPTTSGVSNFSSANRMNGPVVGEDTITTPSATGPNYIYGEGGDDASQLEGTESKMIVPSLTGLSATVVETSFGSQAETEQIQNTSDRAPRLMKCHPQIQSSESAHSVSPRNSTVDNFGSASNRSDKIIPTMEKYAVVVQGGGERNRKQEAFVNNFGGRGESAIASLVKATTGSTTGSSSAITRKSHERQIRARGKTNRVKLHVYDLVADDTQLDLWGCHFPLGQVFNAFNSSLHSIGTGAYHVGIEIDGVEYAFGANSTKGLTGVFTCMPKNSPGYQFRTTIDFGDRVMSQKSIARKAKNFDGREIVRDMAREYLGTDYDLLRKNCCTFARDACIRLGIDEAEIPSWFHNLAEVGAVTQDAANFTLAPIAQLFSGDQLEKFADYINETSLDDKAIQDMPSEEKETEEHINNTAYQF